jgi:HEAT repeat protein/beta-lactamase regulating signal transducer with metallopeptidase domain
MTTFSWLPDAAWRGALLLAIAFVLARLLRSQPAAVRHVLWAGALAGVMAMPILAAVAPVRLPVAIPERLLDAADANPGQGSSAATVQRTNRAEPNTLSGALPDEPSPTPIASPAPLVPANDRAPVDRASLASILALLWAIGAALLGLRLLLGFLALRRIRRQATAIEDPDVLDLMAGCADRIGTHTTPPLLVSSSVAMPCTAGWFRPVVVLPDEHAAWSPDRLEVVLLHELGHIRRMDIVPHLLGEVARVVYWFNPLVWLAASRLRAEAESATDDRVVHAGARPSDYADHLLDIVIQARKVWHPAPLIPLARRSEFEGRILAILESGGRALPSARRAMGVLVLVAGMSLGVASMGGAAAGSEPDSDPAHTVFDTSSAPPDDDERMVEHEKPAAPRSEKQNVDRVTNVGALAEALRDPVASVRQAAAQALGSARDSVAVRALMEVLRSDQSALVRRSAAWSLGEIADAAAIPVLSEALTRDRDAEVRKNAASALGSIDNPRGTPALTQALERDTEVSVRIQAAESLSNIEDPASIDALIRALDRDDDPDVRRAVINAIDNLEDARALPAVSRALRDADAEVRSAAADALGSMDDRDAVPALLAAARDANADVRRDVVNALSNLQDRRAIPAFVTALSDTEVEVRRAAAEGFNNLENVRSAPSELLRAMDDRDAEVRHAAAHALGGIGDPEAVRVLIAHISDANVEVRRAVVDALDEFDDPAVAGALRTALRDTDPEVRESAARALGNRSRSK